MTLYPIFNNFVLSVHANYTNEKELKSSTDDMKKSEPSKEDELPQILEQVKEINSHFRNQKSDGDMTDEWTHIATIWERFMFWIVLVVVVIAMLAMFLKAFYRD